MILLTVAAFAQAPTVAASTRDAAMNCAAATFVTAGELNVRLMSVANYYVMHAASADPQGKPIIYRFHELMGQLPDYATPMVDGGSMAGRGPAIVQECERVYPQARATDPTPLPEDRLERDLLCLGIVTFVEGAGRDSRPTGGAPTHEEIVAAQEAFRARLPDSRTEAAGLPDEAAVTLRLFELIVGSIRLGNTEAVSRSCLADLRG